jgi:hypothetical protein
VDKKTTAAGGTRWKRFGLVMVPAVVVLGAMGVGVAQGAVPVSMTISGGGFKMKVDKLEGTGFSQYGSFAKTIDGKPVPVANSAFKEAKITNLCQSVKIPSMFGMPQIILKVKAGGKGSPATAKNLVVNLDALEGDATFKNIDIGIDASTMTKGPGADGKGAPTMFGQQADVMILEGGKQFAYGTSADEFYLKDLSLKLEPNGEECF